MHELLMSLRTLDPDGGSTAYYYGNNPFHARHPVEVRNRDDDLQLIQSIAEEN